jgi:hypothetical protein
VNAPTLCTDLFGIITQCDAPGAHEVDIGGGNGSRIES